MSGKITLTGESDVNRIMRDYDKLIAKNAELEGKLRQVSQEGAGGQDKMAAAVDRGIDRIRNMLMTYISVNAVIKAGNDLLEHRNRLEQESLGAKMTIADAQAQMRQNMIGISLDAQNRYIADVAEIARRSGVSPEVMYRAGASGISGTGGDARRAIEILEQLAPLFRGQQMEQQLEPAAGAVGDIMKITRDPDVAANIGLVLNTMKQARITSLEKFKNVAPGLVAATQYDTQTNRSEATREAAALFAAIGQGIADPEGATTKTALAALSKQLETLLPEGDVLDPSGQVLRRGTGLQTNMQRIRAVQGDVKLQREFFQGYTTENVDQASFRAPVYAAIRAMLTDPDSTINRELAKNLQEISFDPSQLGALDASLNADRTGRTLTRSTRAAAALKLTAAGSSAGDYGAAFKIGRDLLGQYDEGAFSTLGVKADLWSNRLIGLAGRDAQLEDLIAALTGRLGDLIELQQKQFSPDREDLIHSFREGIEDMRAIRSDINAGAARAQAGLHNGER